MVHGAGYFVPYGACDEMSDASGHGVTAGQVDVGDGWRFVAEPYGVDAVSSTKCRRLTAIDAWDCAGTSPSS